MSIVICTGTEWAAPEHHFASLQQHGVAAAHAPAGGGPNIHQWHDRVIGPAHHAHRHGPRQLGKAWEQAAGEIFLANWGAASWGWADSRSLWLLEFWRDYDPEVRFVLCSIDPLSALVQQALAPAAAPAPSAVLEHWLGAQKHMLHFYLRHPERCEWLHTAPAVPAQPTEAEVLAHHLSAQILAQHPHIQDFFEETLASVAAQPAPARPAQPSAQQAWQASVQAHAAQRSLAQALDAATQAQARLQTELEQQSKHLHAQLDQLQEELNRHFLEHQAATQALKAATTARDAAQQHATALGAERDAANKARDEATKARDAATKALDEATQARKQLQTQLEQLQAQPQGNAALEAELKQENELLLAQLHQVQEELERYFLQHQEADHRLQQLEAQAKQDQARWQRLYLQHPDYIDWERIEVLGISEQMPEPFIQWRVIGLRIGPRAFGTFDCATRLAQGHPVLAFAPGPAQQPAAPLLRWPLAAQGQPELRIQPLGSDDTLAPRLGVLMGLAASDWRMVQAVVDRLLLVLAQPMPEGGQGRWPRREYWQAPLLQLKTALAQAPAFLRYDQVELLREHTQPGLEHLALRLHHPQFAGHQWPQLEFRLAATAIAPGGFSRQPRLEFMPAAAGQPPVLQAWQANLSDTQGERFAITLDLDRHCEIGHALATLSQADWQQLKALLIGLPTMLAWVKKGGAQLSRPWQQWLQLVGDTANLVVRLEATAHPATPATPASPASPQAAQPAPAQPVPAQTAPAAAAPAASRQPALGQPATPQAGVAGITLVPPANAAAQWVLPGNPATTLQPPAAPRSRRRRKEASA